MFNAVVFLIKICRKLSEQSQRIIHCTTKDGFSTMFYEFWGILVWYSRNFVETYERTALRTIQTRSFRASSTASRKNLEESAELKQGKQRPYTWSYFWHSRVSEQRIYRDICDAPIVGSRIYSRSSLNVLNATSISIRYNYR